MKFIYKVKLGRVLTNVLYSQIKFDTFDTLKFLQTTALNPGKTIHKNAHFFKYVVLQKGEHLGNSTRNTSNFDTGPPLQPKCICRENH